MGILFLIFFGLILLGTVFPAALGLALYQNSMFAGDASLGFIARHMVTSMDNFTILAIPIFMLAGEVMGQAGISKRLFDLSNSLVGRFRGGLPMATIVTLVLFGAVSGSGPATLAAVGSIMIPLLVKQGYDKKFAVGITTAGAGVGIIIPPSIPMVMYAIAANQSIGDMFAAGVIPGLLVGASLMIYAYFYCLKNPINIIDEELKPQPLRKTLKEGIWAILTPFIILGGIYGGIFTPTEAAAVSLVYAILIGIFIYKEITIKDLPKYVYNAAALNAPILIIVALSSVFGRILTFEGIPAMVADLMLGITENPWILLILINLLLLTVGTFIDTLSKVIIMTPILLPMIVAVGIDPVHFGVIMIVNFSIGLITPPTGISLFVAAAMTKIPFLELSKSIIKPMFAMLIVLLLVTFIPALSLILL